MCFVGHKTTSKLKCVMLTTVYLASAKTTDGWCARKGDLQHAFSLDTPMVTSPKLSFVANDNNPTGVSLALGMVHSGSPSSHTTLEDSSDEGGATSGVRGGRALDPSAPEGAMW
jgi:hypothetical protein